MRSNQVALGNGALDVEAHLEELLHQVRDELNERFKSVGGLGVVLDAVWSAILLRNLNGASVAKCLIVVGEHCLPVLLGVSRESSSAMPLSGVSYDAGASSLK